MGIAYRTDPARRLVVAVVDGQVSADEFYEVARRQADDPTWRDCIRSLIDASTADVSPLVPPERLNEIAEQYARMRASAQPYRAAIVAGEDRTLAGRYSDRRSDSATRILSFRDLEPACMWLGVNVDDARGMLSELRDHLRGVRASGDG